MIKPGDALLYYSTKNTNWFFKFFAWAVRVKTWHKVSHIEVYIGNKQSIGARPEGVDIYESYTDGCVAHIRPNRPFDLNAAMKWFNDKAKGQQYDFLGLFRFFSVGKESQDKQFCSELATRFYRAGGLEPFQPGEDADYIAPGTFLQSSAFDNLKDETTLVYDWQVENVG